MASEYTRNLSSVDRMSLSAAIVLLESVLAPYRSVHIIERKLWVFSLSITIGEVLDWLDANFGPRSVPGAPVG